MDEDRNLLTALGVSVEDEAVYRALLAHPGATLAGLAAVTGHDPARVRRRTVALERLGLLTRVPGRPVRFRPAPPDVAAEALALACRAEIERARIGAARLAEEYQAARPDVHLVRGAEAVVHRLAQARSAARSEVLALGVAGPDRLTPGVGYRVVHAPSELDLPAVRALVDQGGQARVADRLPLSLVVVDGAVALAPCVLAGEPAAVEVRSPVLLAGFVALFDLLWRHATPLFPGARSGTALTCAEEEILGLCAAGLSDRAIARRLGVAQRTVERRMHALMDRLGARTRFQAGLRAAGHGFGGDPAGGAALEPAGGSARAPAGGSARAPVGGGARDPGATTPPTRRAARAAEPRQAGDPPPRNS